MSEREVHAPADVPVAAALARLAREGRPGVCDTGRYLCRYALWGEGPPLVFVHGLGDVARSFAMVAAELSRDFTCVLYELPTGEGDLASLARYRHADYAADLLALLDHLGQERTYLFASSFGSTIGIRAMADRPGRFARTVLQGAFARRTVSPAEVIICQFARYLPGKMRQFPFHASLANQSDAAVLAQVPEARAFMHENCGGVPIHTVARMALSLAGLDLRPSLSKLRLPIRMIGGDRDGIVPRACEEELLAGLPGAERLEIPGCGHMPQYTHPGLLAELTRQFFTPDCGRVKHDDCHS